MDTVGRRQEVGSRRQGIFDVGCWVEEKEQIGTRGIESHPTFFGWQGVGCLGCDGVQDKEGPPAVPGLTV